MVCVKLLFPQISLLLSSVQSSSFLLGAQFAYCISTRNCFNYFYMMHLLRGKRLLSFTCRYRLLEKLKHQ